MCLASFVLEGAYKIRLRWHESASKSLELSVSGPWTLALRALRAQNLLRPLYLKILDPPLLYRPMYLKYRWQCLGSMESPLIVTA